MDDQELQKPQDTPMTPIEGQEGPSEGENETIVESEVQRATDTLYESGPDAHWAAAEWTRKTFEKVEPPDITETSRAQREAVAGRDNKRDTKTMNSINILVKTWNTTVSLVGPPAKTTARITARATVFSWFQALDNLGTILEWTAIGFVALASKYEIQGHSEEAWIMACVAIVLYIAGKKEGPGWLLERIFGRKDVAEKRRQIVRQRIDDTLRGR